MSAWRARKSRHVVKRQTGSPKVLTSEGYPDHVFAFHDREEIGPRMLARISRYPGLKPHDLWSVKSAG